MAQGGKRNNAGRKPKYNEKTVAIRIPESMLESVQKQLQFVQNQNLQPFCLPENDSAQKQLSEIKAIVDRYETESLNNTSPRWVNAKRLIAELKPFLSN